MKKIIMFLFCVLILFNFTSCPDDDKNKNDEIVDTKVIDSKLIGYYGEIDTDTTYLNYYYVKKNYYRLTKNTFEKCTPEAYHENNDKFIAETSIKAYTKNNKLLSYEDDSVILSYAINSILPNLQEDREKASQGVFYIFDELKEDQENGRIIKLIYPDNTEIYLLNSTSRLLDYVNFF
jgi:hypothetical protein